MGLRVNYLLLATALLGTFFSGTATRIVNISLPTIASSLGTDLVGVSWALLSYQLSNIGLSIIFGRLADLWSREKIFALGFLVFAVSSLLCGFSGTVLQLILFRFLQGVGGAMLQSSSRALAAEAVPEKIGGRAQGYMTTAHHVGFLLGPGIGGVMIDYLNWRWSFFFLVPIGLIGAGVTLMSILRRGENKPSKLVSVDYVGAFLLVATTTSLVLIFDRRTSEILGTSFRLLLGAVFIVCLVGLVSYEARARNPFVKLDLFRIRPFTFSVFSLLLMAICYAFTGFLVPFYLQKILNFSPTRVGLIFMVPSILTVALAPISGYMTDRLGPRAPATLGALIMVASLGMGALLRPDSHWLLPTSIIVLGAMTNGIFNPSNSMAMIGLMPQEHRGFASAMNHVTFGLGNVFGVSLSSLLMSLAFERYTGVTSASPSTGNPVAFVVALNATFLFTAALSSMAVLTSAFGGDRKRPPAQD